MSEPKIYNDLSLSLRTLTPLSIGSDKGEVLSPYADFIFSDDGKKLRYLNLSKIEEAVSQQQKMDEYVRGIQSGMDNNRSDFNLYRFVTGSLKLELDDVTRRAVPQHGLRPGDRRNVVPTVKNAHQPYLPGSSLKGALRTALLYDWLVNTKVGEIALNEAVALLEKMAKMEDFKKREKEALAEQVFTEESLMGWPTDEKKSPWGPDARFLHVSDSKPLSPDALAVYALRRIRLKPGLGKSAIPQVLEAIPPGQYLRCSLSIDPWLREKAENKPLDYLVDGDFKAIFANLGAFSRDCIANELYELRDATTRDFEKEVDGLVDFYEKLQRRAEAGAVFLRLGFGKTANDNSLTLALANGLQDQTAFHQFRAHFHKLKRENDLFPITRTVTPEGEPMGWVEVSMP